jgi:hypothetical protein
MAASLSSPFTPAAQGAIVVVAGAAVLLAAWKIIHELRRKARPIRYGPFGLALMLLSLAFLGGVVVYGLPLIVDYPLMVITVPFAATVAFSLACAHDQKLELAEQSEPPSYVEAPPIWQRHFFAPVGIPLFAVFIMVIGGCKNIDIALHEGRTTATVTGVDHSRGGHGALLYRYEVDGHPYSGSGDPGNPSYPGGSTFEIRYSTLHPSFSIAHSPFTIFGQFLVGSLILLWVDYTAVRRWRK